jgi:hypothetical protein
MPAMHPEITCNEGAHGEADVFPNTMTSPPANKGITGSVESGRCLVCYSHADVPWRPHCDAAVATHPSLETKSRASSSDGPSTPPFVDAGAASIVWSITMATRAPE